MICLKVMYGYPLGALYGFLGNQDYEIWERHLGEFSNEISVNFSEGIIYWVVENGDTPAMLRAKLTELPLVKEGFLELRIHELTAFNNLKCWFDAEKTAKLISVVN